AAALARSLALPVTKVSKVKAGFSRDTSRTGVAATGRAGVLACVLTVAGEAAAVFSEITRSTDAFSPRRSRAMSRIFAWKRSRTQRWTKRLGAVTVTAKPEILHWSG